MDALNELLIQLKSPAQYLSSLDLSFWFFLLQLFSVFVLLLIISYLVIKLILTRRLLSQPQIILEVNPLRITEQSPFTTEQLFNMIHGLARQVPRCNGI